jgi:hypothetical protein
VQHDVTAIEQDARTLLNEHILSTVLNEVRIVAAQYRYTIRAHKDSRDGVRAIEFA